MKIGIVGAPVDLGQQRRGVDMGPSAIRIAKLREGLEELGHSVRDFGNIPAADMATASVGDKSVRYLPDVVAQCEALASKVADAVHQGLFPLVLGGDQSTSIGTFAGLARTNPRQGIIWLDAHGDFNTTRTTPSGNIHGMALAAILGYGHPKLTRLGGVSPKAVEENTVLIGGRSFDPDEAEAISKSKVKVYTMKEIDELGMKKVMSEAIKIAGTGVDDVHLSFDVDVVDPREAPGTGTPVRGGITYREAHLAMEMLSDSEKVTSAEFVEVNPILDTSNHTAELAVELAHSLFGKRIIP
ncbi:MAG TPA: arginase [Nitrososphaerales archaeon]|nr:arginase [Nitrososphaerales archaeon]